MCVSPLEWGITLVLYVKLLLSSVLFSCLGYFCLVSSSLCINDTHTVLFREQVVFFSFKVTVKWPESLSLMVSLNPVKFYSRYPFLCTSTAPEIWPVSFNADSLISITNMGQNSLSFYLPGPQMSFCFSEKLSLPQVYMAVSEIPCSNLFSRNPTVPTGLILSNFSQFGIGTAL